MKVEIGEAEGVKAHFAGHLIKIEPFDGGILTASEARMLAGALVLMAEILDTEGEQ